MHRALCRPPAYTHTRLRGKEGPPGLRCGRAGSGWGGKHSEAPSARSARGHEHRAGGGGCAVSGARPLCSPVLFVWAQSGDPPLPPPPTPPARLPPHPELFPTLHSPHPAGLVHSAISAFGHSQRRNRDIQRRGGKRKQPRPQAERLPAMLAELQPPPAARGRGPRWPFASGFVPSCRARGAPSAREGAEPPAEPTTYGAAVLRQGTARSSPRFHFSSLRAQAAVLRRALLALVLPHCSQASCPSVPRAAATPRLRDTALTRQQEGDAGESYSGRALSCSEQHSPAVCKAQAASPALRAFPA